MSRDQMRLEGKVIIVTGAARGIGREYALALAKEGANLVVTDVLVSGINETASEIERMGGRAIPIRADVSLEEDTKKMAEETSKQFGRIDALVNNAALYGGLKRRPFYEIEVEEWDRVQAINVRGTWLCIKSVFPYMKQAGRGKIVNISSGTFFAGSPGLSHYVASKGAVIGITRGICRELGQFNITINAIAPGYTLTDATLKMNPDPKYATEMANTRALKRDQYPKDLIGAMIFLCSDDSDFMTGQTLLIDGGRSMH
ncbi:MAG: SDR family NAD(P)-dependent oxidoreductase [Nitrososphaerales archaeon]